MDVVLGLMVFMDHAAPWPEDSNTGKKKGGSQARHGAPCLCCSPLDYTNEKESSMCSLLSDRNFGFHITHIQSNLTLTSYKTSLEK